MNTGVNYKLFYEILLNLRENYHSYGRIDDSNAKLDEIVKLIMLAYFEALQGKSFSLLELKKKSIERYGNEGYIAKVLRDSFRELAKSKLFMNEDSTSIFGANPTLNIQDTENLLAERLVSEIEKIDFIYLLKKDRLSDFDILNECFGHFVRDNFRNNKEDAQYMTPAEITLPILEMVFKDFKIEGYFDNLNKEDFLIMDPTCGVGTLLIESGRKYLDCVKKFSSNNSNFKEISEYFLKNGMIGQDKVDRMVRLSKINTLLFGANLNNIHLGNSISETTFIDNKKEKVDFIFTNPPFGAEYEFSELNYSDYQYIKRIGIDSKKVQSELLLLIKCLGLLKENGKLAIILPDGIFSSNGVNARLREYIISNFTINAIIQMPSVTFAQAGTRTKTSILYLTNKQPEPNHKIMMGVCNDIGYIVKEKNGVPIKISKGKNEMIELSEKYISNNSEQIIVSYSPSLTQISYGDLIDQVLNPSFYSANRMKTIYLMNNMNTKGFELRRLGDIVEFQTIGRKNYHVDEHIKHISVLHVNPDSTINFQLVKEFEPVSKGRECFEGDIIFSKINPRIPRMAVIPNFEYKLVCSNEFEILRPKIDLDGYVICMMLKTSYVSRQIENLTSGTSSSHNRIKREQLAEILIPYPTTPETLLEMNTLSKEIKNSIDDKYMADTNLENSLTILEKLI